MLALTTLLKKVRDDINKIEAALKDVWKNMGDAATIKLR